jgi:hypothetical protein
MGELRAIPSRLPRRAMMDEINLQWPGDLPPEWMPVIRQHAEAFARRKLEAALTPDEICGLTIAVTGATPADMNLRVQGPPKLLRRVENILVS